MKVDEAFMEPEWIQAMQEKLQQFELNNVCELVKRPDPRKHNIIGTKWIYRNNHLFEIFPFWFAAFFNIHSNQPCKINRG